MLGRRRSSGRSTTCLLRQNATGWTPTGVAQRCHYSNLLSCFYGAPYIGARIHNCSRINASTIGMSSMFTADGRPPRRLGARVAVEGTAYVDADLRGAGARLRAPATGRRALEAHIAHGDGPFVLTIDPPLHLASTEGPHRASNVECIGTRNHAAAGGAWQLGLNCNDGSELVVPNRGIGRLRPNRGGKIPHSISQPNGMGGTLRDSGQRGQPVNKRAGLVRITFLSSVLAAILLFTATVSAQEVLERKPNLQPFPADKLALVGGTTLLFSTTSWNNGSGPLELRAGETGSAGQNVYQRVYLSDGGFYDRLAGTFEWHPEHNHFHFQDYALYTLQPVNAPGGSQRTSSKTTFCVVDTTRVDTTLPGAPGSAVYTTCGPSVQGMSVTSRAIRAATTSS
jgi:hypothetical protein